MDQNITVSDEIIASNNTFMKSSSNKGVTNCWQRIPYIVHNVVQKEFVCHLGNFPKINIREISLKTQT